MRILFINDNSAHPNWGAQATPYSLIQIIQRAMPDAEIEPIPWDWLRKQWFGSKFPALFGTYVTPERFGRFWPIIRRASWKVDFYPKVADDFDRVADEWVAGGGGPDAREFISAAQSSDLVIYNGENSIYRNTVEGCHGLFLLWLAKTRLNKPSCLINHTTQLNEVRAIMNAMVALVNPALDLVSVRECRSLRTLHDLGIETAELYPDVVFAVDPDEIPSEPVDAWKTSNGPGNEPYFCLSSSGLPMSQPSGKDLGAVGELVVALKELGPRAVLLARDHHCQFLREVADRTGSHFFGPEHHFTELWSLFRSAEFSVTGHFHYMIMGSSVGCPFIPLSNNNHKVHGVCELLEWHRTTPFDATWLRREHDAIVDEARFLLKHQTSLRDQLMTRSAILRTDARRLGERLRDIATGASHGGTP